VKLIRILCFGDVVGTAGCALFQKYATRLKQQFKASLIIVNGENSVANGRGITPKVVASLRHCGADMVTGGNHIFQQRDIHSYLNERSDLLRPANFPSGCPGKGVGFIEHEGIKVAVINLQGRVFMSQHLECPLKTLESLLSYTRHHTPIAIVDFHAEASAEKIGLALAFEGQITAVVGTHTHVQTADERLLPKGTAFITDLGMAGALNSMIGMKKEGLINQLLTQMPTKFEVDTEGPFVISGVVIDVDVATGKATHIERFRVIDTEISFGTDKNKTLKGEADLRSYGE